MPHTADWPLAELQSRMATALLAADDAGRELPATLFAGALPGAEGLRVHRNTVLGALSNVLRLVYPAVDRLVGEAFFDRMAVEFARAQPPTAPHLSGWGADFAAYLRDFPGTEALPYLSELARFDSRFDQLARRVADEAFRGVELAIDPTVRLCFVAGLRVHSSRWPVAALRDAILADDAAALGAIDCTPGEHHVAMWRTGAGIMVQPLGAVAARYLQAVLEGATSEQALLAASAGAPRQDAGPVSGAELAAQLQREVLQAKFVQITTNN